MLARRLLANKLKEFRLNHRLSQTELGKLVGVSKNTISSYETGNKLPTAYHAARLCSALDCKFEDLFYIKIN